MRSSRVVVSRWQLSTIVVLCLALVAWSSSNASAATDAAASAAKPAAAASASRSTASPAATARADALADAKDGESDTGASAAAAAKASDSPVEDLSQRTETTQVFANPDGSWKADESAEPVRVKQDDGSWEDIDTTLEAVDGGFAPKAAIGDLTISDGGDKSLASLTVKGKDLDWSWPTTLPQPTIEGSTATYADVVPNGDLVVTATPTGFSHALVLRAAPTEPLSITMPVATDGTSLTEKPDGSLEVATKSGDDLVSAPNPTMYDAGTDAAGVPDNEVDLGTKITKSSDGAAVTLKPDQGYLTNPDTQYPVTIDPNYNVLDNPAGDTWIYNTSPTAIHPNDDTLHVGTPGSGAKYRSFFKFSNGPWSGGAVISSSVLRLRNFAAKTCSGSTVNVTRVTQDWAPGSINWNNQPDYTIAERQGTTIAKGYSGSCPSDDVDWNTAPIIQAWSNGAPNYGLRLAAYDESVTSGYREFRSASYTTDGGSTGLRPRLIVNYNHFPNTPTGTTISGQSGSNLTTLQPRISATTTDRDGAPTAMQYDIFQGSGTSPIYSGQGSQVDTTSGVSTAKVPAGVLTVGNSYTIKTYGWDGQYRSGNGGAGGAQTITLTTVAPPGPPTPTITPGSTYNSTFYAASTQPTVQTTATDVNGGTVTASFEVAATAGGTPLGTCTSDSVASGSAASCQLPASAGLNDGATYYVRARISNGYDTSEWSSAAAFTVTTGIPATPTISCTGYPNTSWTTAVPAKGTTVPCTISAPTASGNTPSTGIAYTVGNGTEQTVSITPDSDASKANVTIQVPATEGRHTITASALSMSGVRSAPSNYWFGFGQHVGLETPATGPPTVTTNRIAIAASGRAPDSSSDVPDAHVYWRLAGSGADATTGWTKATSDAENLKISSSSATGAMSVTGAWDASQATETASGTKVDPRVPALLDVEVCIGYTAGTDCSWESTNGSRQILRVAHAFDDSFPVQDVEGGKVALWTGEFTTGATDAMTPDGTTSLSVSRTASTFDGPAASPATAVFGPGWTASLDGPEGGLADMQLIDRSRIDGTLVAIDGEGTPMVFAPAPGIQRRTGADLYAGSWPALDQDTREAAISASVAKSGNITQVTLSEPDGTKTVFGSTTAPSATTDAVFAPGSVTEAGQPGSTQYAYDSGRVARIVAPGPGGSNCAASGTMAAGCRALQIAYTTVSVPAGSNDPGVRVSSISSLLGGTATAESSYTYDGSGRLSTVKNERNGLVTKYTYDGTSNRLSSIAPPGLTQVTYEYAGDQNRLARVKRVRPDSAGGGTATLATILYDIPTTGTGLPAMDASHVSAWGQSAAPTYAAAVFGADKEEGTLDPSAVPSGDWASADLSYTDARGYEINTASYGAGDWLPTWTSYDTDGDPVRQLDAGDIAAVRSGAVSATSAGTTMVYNAAHTANGAVVLPAGTVMTDIFGPARIAVLDSGARRLVRPHTKTTYDQGAPNGGINPDTGQEWALPTTVTVTAADASTLNDLDTLSKTTTAYDDAVAGDSTAGWRWGLAGSTTQVMASTDSNITSRTRYDTRGRVIAQIQPKSNGSDAGTRQTSYYTADGTGDCGGKPAWDGLPCKTSYGAAPDSGPVLPTSITTYDDQQRPTQVTETSNGATRSTTTTYRKDGQPATTETTAAGDGSAARPLLTYSYSDTTALLTTTTPSKEGAGASITTGYDNWGRTTTYSAAQGESTTTTYDAAGRISKVEDPKGTTTWNYDGTDANGQLEHRGLATSMSVSNPGGRDITLSGAYDARGNVVVQKLPGGITQRSTYDSAGEPTARSYAGDVTTKDTSGKTTTKTDQVWLDWEQDNDAAGRVRRESTPAGAAFTGLTTGAAAAGFDRQYTYDQGDRLTRVNDKTAPPGAGVIQRTNDDGSANTSTGQAATQCTTRNYIFDRNSNRTAKTTTPSGSNGSCGTNGATTKTSTYDTADRLTGGYVYDQFGRQTTIPQADTAAGAQSAATGMPAPDNLTIGYYSTDAAKTITQNGATTTYSLDTAGRRLAATFTKSGVSNTVLTRHYTDTSDNPGWTTTDTGSGSTTSTVTDRYAEGLDGDLAVDISSGSGAGNTVSVPLTDLHGDTPTQVTLSASGNATGLDSWQDTDEYGNQLGQTPAVGKTTTNVGGHGAGYGWLGAKQRAIDVSGLTLMGTRVYNSITTTFSSVDSIFHGNTSAYAYPRDPENSSDLDGRRQIDPGGSGAGDGEVIIETGAGEGAIGELEKVARSLKIPFPLRHSKSARRSDHYIVYQIDFKGTYSNKPDVYKYGITRQVPPSRRFNVGVRACRNDRRTDPYTCGARIIDFNAGNYYWARLKEVNYIANYKRRYGHCPIGQPSCK